MGKGDIKSENKGRQREEREIGISEGVEERVTKIINKIQKTELPFHQRKALGLDENWNKNISKDFVKKVLGVKEAYKEALKELEKY